MDGTVYKRKLASGKITWSYEINAGKDENAKQIRIVKGGFEKKGDVENEKNRRLQELNDGHWVRPSPKSFQEFLAEWMREHAEQHCSPKTVERYRQLAAYIVPTLGRFQLRKISPLMLERVYANLRKSGGRGRGKGRDAEKKASPLPVKTVRHIAGLVHVALATAVRWKLIRTNPADACVLPELVKQEAAALDESQTQWYLDAARGTFMYPIMLVAAATGCRRGELLALTWADLSLDSDPPMATISKSLEQTKGGLRIKSPKNGKPRRLTLPAFAVEALREDTAMRKAVDAAARAKQ
jgi:integrase